MYNDNKNEGLSGHVINEFHYNRLCDLLKDCGGEVVMGNANAHNDKKLEPTIVLNPDRNSPLMRDEIFGPIWPLLTYKTIDEVI